VTGRELITASLRLIGALAPGETLASQEATDGLASLNRMIDSWSTEGLVIHAITSESAIALTAGDATVTLGALGDLTTRPMELVSVVYRDGTLDYPPLVPLTAEQYAAIPIKTIQSIPGYYYDDGGYPQRTLTLYPAPSSSKSLMLFTKRALTALTLDGTVSLPPGYERALVYNGAIELAPEYGKAAPAEVVAIATDSKAMMMRANYKPLLMSSGGIPSDRARGRFNIRTGGYGP
jgi:hypothetical protein